ncbi:uncharacterized protein B0H18DRAFT_1112028 [Fomitopsis serialis]|uniref:uncharacterized protein n=1 Tax=Fomitopsis serialis TaxID=139415 RepID=UPI002007D2F7|nr:uncharacterized protein B0H18DRAFT_1112028 [Neoantrodia serialis]KAH9906575.1 hypothetical protein B0H18DRAFT_1112028 [Neoantrodia serialis]
MQSPMPDPGETISNQADEPKAQRVFIFREDTSFVDYVGPQFTFVGDMHVENLAKQTPRSLVELSAALASSAYPELKGMVVWQIVENATPLNISDRATWREMEYMLLEQRSWSVARFSLRTVEETVVHASIPAMGRIDFSDVKNPLIVFFKSLVSVPGQGDNACWERLVGPINTHCGLLESAASTSTSIASEVKCVNIPYIR